MSEVLKHAERTRLRRLRGRGHSERETIHAMPMCHVGYVLNGSLVVMPTIQLLEGDHVYVVDDIFKYHSVIILHQLSKRSQQHCLANQVYGIVVIPQLLRSNMGASWNRYQ